MPSRIAADDAAAVAESLAPVVADSPALIWIKDLQGTTSTSTASTPSWSELKDARDVV